MRILYFDYFSSSNSNFFWRDAFAKLGKVEIVHANVHGKNLEGISAGLTQAVNRFKPTHLHMGGSIKSVKVIPGDTLRQLKKSGTRITWFYGDAYNNSVAQNSLMDAVDNVYITNASHLSNANAIPILCPYDQKVYRPHNIIRTRDLVFVGNPHTADRALHVEALSKKYKVDVYGGNGWKKYKVNHKGMLGHSQFSKVLSNYKIALGEPARAPCKYIGLGTGCIKKMPMFKGPVCRAENCDKYEGLRQYYSNRLANVLASGVMHLVHYVDGVEELFENHKDIVWYKNNNELYAQIDRYLKDDKLRERVAKAGFEFIKNYNFDNIAKRIVYGEEKYSGIQATH